MCVCVCLFVCLFVCVCEIVPSQCVICQASLEVPLMKRGRRGAKRNGSDSCFTLSRFPPHKVQGQPTSVCTFWWVPLGWWFLRDTRRKTTILAGSPQIRHPLMC